jgi:general secretion pathway protein G
LTPGGAEDSTRWPPGESAAPRARVRLTRAAGFTLVEVLIVLALLGTWSAIAVPIYFRTLESARVERAVADIKNISSGIGIHRI